MAEETVWVQAWTAKVAGSVAVEKSVLAQVQGTEWEWVEASERESALARGMVLHSVIVTGKQIGRAHV